MTWLEVPVFASFLAYIVVVARSRGFLTADALFAYFQLIMIAGTLPSLDTSVRSDVVYGYVLGYSFIAYVLVCTFISLIGPQAAGVGLFSGAARIVVTRASPRIWWLIIFCIVVTSIYYIAVGYSALLIGLRAQLAGNSNVDIATLRLNSYSGSRYFAPGYVNQFKNVLLPALVVIVVTHFCTTRFRHLIVLGVLILLTLLGILGTGQRGAFVLSVVMVIVYLYLLDRSQFRQRFTVVALFAVAVSAVSTLSLGRSSQKLSEADGLASKVGALLAELWSRILDSNQGSGIAGFRYTYGLRTQWGQDWLGELLALLPGGFKQRGPTLENYIFASLYGGIRGTSPPSLWGSIYYNFGFFGIAVAPFFFAFALRKLSDVALRRLTYTTLELVGIAGTFTTVGTWVAGGPNYLANVGTGMFLVVWRVGRRASDREHRRLSATEKQHKASTNSRYLSMNLISASSEPVLNDGAPMVATGHGGQPDTRTESPWVGR